MNYSLTHSLTHNLKSRDVSTSKNRERQINKHRKNCVLYACLSWDRPIFADSETLYSTRWGDADPPFAKNFPPAVRLGNLSNQLPGVHIFNTNSNKQTQYTQNRNRNRLIQLSPGFPHSHESMGSQSNQFPGTHNLPFC